MYVVFQLGLIVKHEMDSHKIICNWLWARTSREMIFYFVFLLSSFETDTVL